MTSTTSSGSVHVTYREDLRECLYYDADSSSDELSAILLDRRKQELSKKGLSAEEQSDQVEHPAVMEKLRFSPDSQRIEQLRDTVGDFGLALFAPLLNLGGEQSSEDSDSSSSLSLKMTTTTKKSASPLTLRTEPDSDHYRSEDDDFEEEEENDHTYLQTVDEPIHLLRACPRILSHEQMQQLREHLPYKLRDNLWERCFAIGLHGDSFISLLQKCAPHKYTVVVIRTVTGEILGGFASERWSVRDEDRQAAYYGTGQSFVFASHPAAAATAAVVDGENPTTADNSSNSELTVYKWTGSVTTIVRFATAKDESSVWAERYVFDWRNDFVLLIICCRLSHILLKPTG